MRHSIFIKGFLLILVVVFASFVVARREIKIACVGDSITEGATIRWQSKSSYPVRLDSILGKHYTVLNCGRSAATMLKKGDLPYWICNEFSNVFAFQPDIIVIKLGTNDTKPQNWNAENFKNDCQAMLDTFRTIPTKPKIFVCLPVPVYKTMWGINDSTLQKGVIPILQNLAKANNAEIIDLYTPLSNHAEFFPDKIHPNEAGAKLMAEVIAQAIKK